MRTVAVPWVDRTVLRHDAAGMTELARRARETIASATDRASNSDMPSTRVRTSCAIN